MKDIETEHLSAQLAKSDLFFLLLKSDCDQLLQTSPATCGQPTTHRAVFSYNASWPPQGGQHGQDIRAHYSYHQPALCSNSSCGSVLFNTKICALNNQISIITHILQRKVESAGQSDPTMLFLQPKTGSGCTAYCQHCCLTLLPAWKSPAAQASLFASWGMLQGATGTLPSVQTHGISLVGFTG